MSPILASNMGFSVKSSKFSLPWQRQYSLPQLNWSTPTTPCLVQESGTYPLYKPSCSKFSVKYSNFRCHGNRGWSGTNFTCTVKFVDPDNPLLQEWVSYLPYMPSYCQFCVQITVVGYHGNRGQSEVNLKDTIQLPDPKNPQFGANSVHVSSKVIEL